MDVFGRIAYRCVFTIGSVAGTWRERTIDPLHLFQCLIVSRVYILSGARIGKVRNKLTSGLDSLIGLAFPLL